MGKAVSARRPARTLVTSIPETIDVKAIRERQGLTQVAFAESYGININTLRQWEQGLRVPEAPTRAYLLVIDRAPGAVLKALRGA